MPGLRGFSIGRGKAQRRLLDISSGPQRWNRVWWSDRGDHLVEIDPIKALEAAMDGFDVADSSTAPTTAERRYAAIEQMPDGVLLANAGHVEAMDLGLTLQARSLAALVDPRTRARRTAISER